jgi:uncharacterized low-complexity protein
VSNNDQQTHSRSTKALGLAIGAVVSTSLLVGPAGYAAENPFGMKALSKGYMVADAAGKSEEGKCGEGKCGGDKKAEEAKCGEGKCGGDKKATEAHCGADKADKTATEAHCGADKKAGEAKCGEGKCGDKKAPEVA